MILVSLIIYVIKKTYQVYIYRQVYRDASKSTAKVLATYINI